MKKVVNKIENQWENWFKIHQNGQMRDVGEKFDQPFDQIISVTKLDWDKPIFSAERGG